MLIATFYSIEKYLFVIERLHAEICKSLNFNVKFTKKLNIMYIQNFEKHVWFFLRSLLDLEWWNLAKTCVMAQKNFSFCRNFKFLIFFTVFHNFSVLFLYFFGIQGAIFWK